MDDSREDSGGKLEVDAIHYFGFCVLAGCWLGQLELLSAEKVEPAPCNEEDDC